MGAAELRPIVGLMLAAAVALLGGFPGRCADLPSVEEHIEKGDLFLDEDKLDEAIDSYSLAVKQKPDSSEGHQRLGRALSLAGDLERGLYECRRAIEIDPKNAAAHATCGLILGLMKQYRQAAAEEFIALRLDPSNASAYLTLGLALASLGDYDGAVGSIYQAIRLQPDNVRAYVNLGAVLGRKGDYRSAAAVYRKALELRPNSVAARLGLGAALGRTGDLQGQVREFRAAVALSPDSDSAHGKLGWALYRAGDLDGALKEGWITNWIRLKRFGPEYLQTFVNIWAGVFLLFGAIFAIIFMGSRLALQADEIIIKSYFLTLYKDRPGRFVITNKRIVFIPEAFSKWFGAKDLSIEREQIRDIDSAVKGVQGRLKVSMNDGSVHEFAMPLFVLQPLRAQLEKMEAQSRIRKSGEMVIPLEVLEASDAGVAVAESGAVQSAEAGEIARPVSEEGTGGEFVTDTVTSEEEIEETRDTKVYTLVDGKLTEAESGEEMAAYQEEADLSAQDDGELGETQTSEAEPGEPAEAKAESEETEPDEGGPAEDKRSGPEESQEPKG